MVVVAVVGGTGHVGATIAEGLRADPNHEVVVLSRKAADGIIAVNYADIDGTAEILRSHNVHTVVNAIDVGNESSSEAQLNLIRAAAKAGSVKRFIVSEWGCVHKPNSPHYGFRQASYAALRETSLEWTRVANGYFLDFWGIPRGLKSQFPPFADFAIDIQNKTAAIPGSGNDTISLIYSYDMVKYLSALLHSTDKWQEDTFFYGDKTTFNEFLKLAEETTGSKFNVTYDSVDKLAKGELTELPSHPPIYQFIPKPVVQGLFSMFGVWVTEGVFDFPEDVVLNKKYPEIQTKKLKDVVALWK